jgi:hypothetical protein
MHDRFRRLKSLFSAVFPKAELPAANDIEIVTELDPLRDGSVYNSNVKGIEYAGKDILSLTWDDILTIEKEGHSTAPDYRYMLNVLKQALERARAELEHKEGITYKKY